MNPNFYNNYTNYNNYNNRYNTNPTFGSPYSYQPTFNNSGKSDSTIDRVLNQILTEMDDRTMTLKEKAKPGKNSNEKTKNNDNSNNDDALILNKNAVLGSVDR